MKGYEELLNSLRHVKLMGYVKTHRAGNTGAGKTLEDLLGIHENYVPGPNGEMVELKSCRKGSKSMLTPFTKSPQPKDSLPGLLNLIGYASGTGKRVLYTTVTAAEYNTIKGKPALNIRVGSQRLELLLHPTQLNALWSQATPKSLATGR